MNATQKFKGVMKRSLLAARVPQVVGRALPPTVTVLRFHSVQEDPQEFSSSIGVGITHSANDFAEQMELVARDFQAITLDDLVEIERCGRRIPRRAVIITFDDGYRDNYEVAAPILNRYGLRAAFYITVDAIGKTAHAPWFCRLRHAFRRGTADFWRSSDNIRSWDLHDESQRHSAFLAASEQCARLTGDRQHGFVQVVEAALGAPACPTAERLMMSWDQVRKARSEGHIVGSHTLTHPNVAFIGEHDLKHELQESKATLEKELGEKVVHFSYPSPILQPHWTRQTIAAARDAGYQTAVTCADGPFLSGYELLCIPRIVVPNNAADLRWRLEINTSRRARL